MRFGWIDTVMLMNGVFLEMVSIWDIAVKYLLMVVSFRPGM